MPEYVWNYDIRQGSEYAKVLSMSHTIPRALQVNEYLLRDWSIQNSVRDLRYSALEK